MTNLCDEIVILGPIGLLFMLYNTSKKRRNDKEIAIKDEEELKANLRAEREEADRLADLEDAKAKKK